MTLSYRRFFRWKMLGGVNKAKSHKKKQWQEIEAQTHTHIENERMTYSLSTNNRSVARKFNNSNETNKQELQVKRKLTKQTRFLASYIRQSLNWNFYFWCFQATIFLARCFIHMTKRRVAFWYCNSGTNDDVNYFIFRFETMWNSKEKNVKK